MVATKHLLSLSLKDVIQLRCYRNWPIIKSFHLRRFWINISRKRLERASNAAGDFVPCNIESTVSRARRRQISLHSLNLRMAVGEVQKVWLAK